VAPTRLAEPLRGCLSTALRTELVTARALPRPAPLRARHPALETFAPAASTRLDPSRPASETRLEGADLVRVAGGAERRARRTGPEGERHGGASSGLSHQVITTSP